MTVNNPALYDAAYTGVVNSNAAWANDSTATDYSVIKAAATAIATQIDSLISTITDGPTLSQLYLMNSAVQSTFANRPPPTSPNPADYSSIAATIVAQFNEFLTGLQDDYVPVPPAAPFVYYLDSSPDGTSIPNYFQLTPVTAPYNPSTQQTATASGTPAGSGTVVQFSYLGNPVAWIAQTQIGEPFVQEGEWVGDMYASVNQPVSTTNLRLSVYVRDTSSNETHLFDIASPRVTLSTPGESTGETTQKQYPCNVTDRLVVKAFAVFTGTTVATTATLYFQGTANASHVHTPIVPIPVP